jgi:uncharacterized protein YjiS (DUF1127 family)
MSASNAMGCGAAAERVDGNATPLRLGVGIGSLLIRVLDIFGDWQDRAAERRQLSRLEDRLLADIGIDRATAMTEGAKPFWKL